MKSEIMTIESLVNCESGEFKKYMALLERTEKTMKSQERY